MLVLVDHYSDVAGGQVVLLELLRELRARRARCRFTLMCPPGRLADAASELGAAVIPTHEPMRELGALHAQEPISRVVVNGLRWLPPVLAWRSSRLGPRRALPEIVYIQHSQPGTLARRLAASMLLPHADRVIRVAAVAPSRANLVDVPPLGLSAQRYESLARRPTCARVGTVKAIGRLDPVKGLDLLACALPRLEERHPAATFEVATAPPIERGSTRYARATRRRLLPFLADGERDSGWFCPGDIVLIPSRSEAVCLTAQEAMAAGCVVVAASVGDLPLLVEDGVSGFLFTPGDVAGLIAAADLALSVDGLTFRRIAATGRARVALRAGAWYLAVVEILAAADSSHES